MKRLSEKEITAIFIIVVIIIVFGFEKALKILITLKILGLNLLQIAFCGSIAFIIVRLIMAISYKFFGIWYGKTGGTILYVITFYFKKIKAVILSNIDIIVLIRKEEIIDNDRILVNLM